MADTDLDHLSDHIELITAKLEMLDAAASGSQSEATYLHHLAVMHGIQERIRSREATEPVLASSVLARRLGLSTTEQQTVWLLCAVSWTRRFGLSSCGSAARALLTQP